MTDYSNLVNEARNTTGYSEGDLKSLTRSMANALEDLSGKEDLWVKWLFDINYPYDMYYDPVPPVDPAKFAAYWNLHDDWRLSSEEAEDVIREEMGING